MFDICMIERRQHNLTDIFFSARQDYRRMASSKSEQSYIDDRPFLASIPLNPGLVTSTLAPPSPLLMHNVTATSMTSMQRNPPLMQFQESGSLANPSLLPMSLPRVPSNASLERVITTSKMAALQSRRGSGSSLANLRGTLMAADNPRRGSAVGQCVHILHGVMLLFVGRELWPPCAS